MVISKQEGAVFKQETSFSSNFGTTFLIEDQREMKSKYNRARHLSMAGVLKNQKFRRSKLRDSGIMGATMTELTPEDTTLDHLVLQAH